MPDDGYKTPGYARFYLVSFWEVPDFVHHAPAFVHFCAGFCPNGVAAYSSKSPPPRTFPHAKTPTPDYV